MKVIAFFLALVTLVIVNGCSTRGNNEDSPASLVQFTPTNTVQVIWSAQAGSGPGETFHQMMPSIDKNNIFAVDQTGKVFSFDLTTGLQNWSVNLDETLVGGVAAGFDQVFLTTKSGELVALSALGGEEIWRQTLSSEATAQVQINQNIVILQQINGRISAYDRSTGEHRWSYDAQLPALTLRGTGIPLLTADVTIAGLANGKIAILDNDNGNLLVEERISLLEGRSELERIVNVQGKPLILEGVLYVVGFQGRLMALDLRTGRNLWAETVSSYRSLSTGFGNIYTVTEDDNVAAYDAASGQLVWSQAALAQRKLTSPVVLNTSVVVGDEQGYLHFVSQIDGRLMARHRVDSSGLQGEMLVKDETLYVLADSGRLVAIELE